MILLKSMTMIYSNRYPVSI